MVAAVVLEEEDRTLVRVRAITRFVVLEPDTQTWNWSLGEAGRLLSELSAAYRGLGYDVQSCRIVTNPFGEFLNCSSAETALAGLGVLQGCLSELDDGVTRVRCAVGAARTAEELALVPAMIAEYGDLCNVCVNVPGDDLGLADAALCDAAAACVAALAATTPRGEGNFNFTANFNCGPGIPYFPAAYNLRENGEIEPGIGLSRQHALFLTLFEMDTMRRTSVSRNHRYLASPLFKLFHKFCPYAPVMSVGIYFALGYLQLPEPRYLAFGRPKFFADLHPELKQKAEKPKGGVPPGSLKVEVKYCGPVTLLVCLFVPCGTLACCFPCDKKAVYQAPDGQRYDRKGRKAVAHPVARALRAAGRGGAYAWDRVRYAYAATAAGAHFAYDAVDALRRGGKLRPKPSHYLKEYYDRADAKAQEEPRVRLSLARDDQKLHVHGAGDAPAAGPGRRPSLAPLDRASSIQVQGAPGGLDKKPLAPIKRRSTVKVKKATSMRWDEATETSDGTEKSGNFGARKESIHWRRQAKQNEEYVDEASAS